MNSCLLAFEKILSTTSKTYGALNMQDKKTGNDIMLQRNPCNPSWHFKIL